MEGKLPQLRAELAGLRQRKRELQQELFDIRAAAETRRKKIEDISELRPVAAINHLPVEVLVPIFQYALSMTGYSRWRQHCIQKQLFAAVSRWWRDIVMNTPSLWTTICVYPTWPSSSVKTHVARSHEYPLDIAFLKQWRKSEGSASLRSVLSCTSRWRSLTIRSKACTQSLLCDLSRVSFPCLKRVHIEGDEDFDVEFPVPDNTPALEQLVLKDSRPGFTLLPSLEKLTMLVLYGGINHLQLGPQSIHLPLLRSLTIDVDRPSMLLQAIVVPGLSHFEASLRDIPSLFDGIPLVFNEVLSSLSPCSDHPLCGGGVPGIPQHTTL
ncbi:hypothetical protein EDC04DRAFT_458272 [Pisolithus marmoratus]|nr:hypothetical protein EDC04DRAFT_458272 [Pisolithus marmoratus]